MTIAAIVATIAPPAGASDTPPTQSRHDAKGFHDNYFDFQPKGTLDVLKWQYDKFRDGLPHAPAQLTTKVDPDLAFIHSNAKAGAAMQPAVTWIGHASALAQFGGLNVMTDPVFSERVSPFGFVGPKRKVAPGLALADLPHIDVVLISHNHYDHLDVDSVRALNAQSGGPPLFLAPLGVKAWMTDVGIDNAVEMDWWQSRQVGAMEIVFTPSQHWSGRGLNDRMQTLWGSYALFAPDFRMFFSGDTAYSKDFADIHRYFAARQQGSGFDLALIAIGAYEPRWFMSPQHVDPAQAVQIHFDIGARQSIGVHWGTFELSDESLDAPPIELAKVRRDRGMAEEAFSVMAIGETRKFSRRSP